MLVHELNLLLTRCTVSASRPSTLAAYVLTEALRDMKYGVVTAVFLAVGGHTASGILHALLQA